MRLLDHLLRFLMTTAEGIVPIVTMLRLFDYLFYFCHPDPAMLGEKERYLISNLNICSMSKSRCLLQNENGDRHRRCWQLMSHKRHVVHPPMNTLIAI